MDQVVAYMHKLIYTLKARLRENPFLQIRRLFFHKTVDHRDYFQLLYIRSQTMPFLERWPSQKTSIFIKNLFLGGWWGPNETVQKAKTFRVDTSINTLSAMKFSNLYLALI